MSLPGYTAEVSLYHGGYGYRAAVKGGLAGSAQVLPQLAGDDVCLRACGSMAVRCYRTCSRLVGGHSDVCFDGCYAAQTACYRTCRSFQF
ncbi:MAG TPA: hypothetical protein VIQ24_16240 [Pyrinomonadaceae bacterium]